MRSQPFRAVVAGILLIGGFLAFVQPAQATPVSFPGIPGQLNCDDFVKALTGALPVSREQDVWPTRTTGVANFKNFTGENYSLEIIGQGAWYWHNLFKGSRFQPYDIWVELPPGEYDYVAHAADPAKNIGGHFRVFETITWPIPLGTWYQEPAAPAQTGIYKPSDPTLSTIVFHNSSQRELTVAVYGQGDPIVFGLNAAGGSGITDKILFVKPGAIDFRVFYDPGWRAQAAAIGCVETYDNTIGNGSFNTKTVRLGQVTLVDFPEP
jgi:hypothetical protein